ncbi:MAG: helix-turn-helix domain-containing protein [Candidatus Obscuribacterales bacterium]|nr:helix-turn-helix domain-containing protein [Candidatus Obscuribacterales bacterium]
MRLLVSVMYTVKVYMTAKRDKNKVDANDQVYWRKRATNLSFGQIIRAYRLAEDWTLTYAAELVGISKQQLSDYENGRKLPSMEKAYQIASALGIMPESVVLHVINEQLEKFQIPIRVDLTG